ncbi:Putative glycosyltransferase EpsD [Lacunisphaera limnophila]|uniref:Glycosyltransferase EpsD n=1 Tax=Lacunisphaera limnophila TaxID=1838286 RepID=A0A1D8AUN0_9BACT|nr:Putative glycosyltransferase EpsD [Lacunisphaera limnophila]
MEILHYTGYDDDRGGIVSVVHALASAGRFGCVLGMNPGAVQRRMPPLRAEFFPALAGELIGPGNGWRARVTARAVQAWLRADPARVFHGHSRAGLLVALWLDQMGERRVVASVHCYGRQRWFYRWAARRLGARLRWLSPAMKDYYGVGDGTWAGCVPGCAGPTTPAPRVARDETAPVRLVGIGALVRWKNWHLVTAALALLPAPVRARLRFTHIGAADGTADAAAYAAQLRRRSEAADLQGLVEWRGEQPSSAGVLAEADVVVVASDHEPFSVAMLEALGAEVPVLAADSGGARDLIRTGENGWLFASGDAAALAGCLRALVETPALRQVHPRPEDLRRFTAPVVAAEWEKIYREVSGA